MSSKKNAGALDYEIGFGKPPSEHWFKPGQSGNPAGRPPKQPASPPKEGGLTSIEASVLRVMRGTVKVKSGEKARWIASTDALAEQLLAQALGGDMRATRLLLNLNRDAEAREAQILAAEHKQVDPLVFAALAEALLLGSKRNALDSDGTLRAIIRRSKSDPFGMGRIAFSSRRSARLVDEWLTWRGPDIEPLFCPVYQGKPIDRTLGTTSVKDMIKAAVAAAGLNVEEVGHYSGHSLRVGAAQDLLCAGFDTAAIMRAGGWRSVNVLGRYLEFAEHNVWM